MGPTISGQPNTIVTLDTTFTSPTVYIAISGSYIYQSNSQNISDFKILIFPQTAASVSSLRGMIGGGFESQAYPFNYADLNSPVPAAAYRGQPKCFTYADYFGTITTVYRASDGSIDTTTSVGLANVALLNLCSTTYKDYNPASSIPPELTSLFIAEANAAKAPAKGNSQSDPDTSPTNGAITTGPDDQQVTAVNDPSNGGVVVSGTTIAHEQSANGAGIGSVAAQTGGSVVNVQSQWFSALAAPTPSAANGAVGRGGNGQAATVLHQGGGSVIIGSVIPPVGATSSIAGIGNVVAQSDGVVVNGASTIPFSAVQGGASYAPADPASDVISIGNQRITAAPNGGFVVALDQTLTPGEQVTVSGTMYPLESGGSAIVVNGGTGSVQHGGTSTSPSAATTTTTAPERGGSSMPSSGNGDVARQTFWAVLQRGSSTSLGMVLAPLPGLAMTSSGNRERQHMFAW
ncbi:hypothetical protein DOTSEDRAFT_24864 [Dothistroma septosporum NZE10]|uniref:Uncharacterized protein n=1 Tax=Dothistroma septosporum (strain NZE10 / CBS 128990) TaxID=675120 RepID=M2Y3F0_DOTSN|nr:hypothetical protein DOTSEDRAFT_24864 [Dothistroma septosporum NZE10]